MKKNIIDITEEEKLKLMNGLMNYTISRTDSKELHQNMRNTLEAAETKLRLDKEN